jgi:acetylornithine deacetylase/succinyl-diaminopimelate desuccinylase-like protein
MAMTSIATDTINLLHKLIGFKTISRDSNKEMIAFICDYLSSFGVETVISSNKKGNNANLYATIGPQQAGGLMLAGHSDVVPVEGQNWTTDPFAARPCRAAGRCRSSTMWPPDYGARSMTPTRPGAAWRCW